MKKAARYLNNLFISLMLAVFYLIIVGISSLFFWTVFLTKSKRGRITYWQDAGGNQPDLKDFESAY